jgi:phosphoserine phosphatase
VLQQPAGGGASSLLLENAAQPALREGRLLRTLSERGVRVVVLSASPEFSPRVAPGLVGELARRYPMTRTVGHFLVMWRT